MSNSFDWLTRLFCSFPNDDTILTVILNLPFANIKCRYAGAENGKKTVYTGKNMDTEVSKL